MNIYIVCAWYEVGMRHYSFTILENLSKHPPKKHQIYVTLVLRNDVENYPELTELTNLNIDYVVIKNSYINILSKILPRFFDSYIKRRVLKYNASLLYIMFEGVFFKDINSIKKKCKVLYTIHDLIPHEKNIATLQDKWLLYTENKRRAYLRENANYIITNAYGQFVELKKMYNKPVFYTSMPTLVNKHIAEGALKPAELNIHGYVLFFGRIDKYKGLDKLVQCHLSSGVQVPLVIAGSGNLWFDIPVTDKIVVINRHIADDELKYLFENAGVCVLPYISVTQTALVSIPFFFKCPVILSAIENFVYLTESSGSLICDFNDAGEYLNCMEKLDNADLRNDIINKQCEYYNKNYDPRLFANSLEAIFDEIHQEAES